MGAFIALLVAARGLIALACTSVVLIASALVLNVALGVATVALLLIGCSIGIVTFSALGFIVANLGNSEGQVAAINNSVTFPLPFLTETFYSLDGAPAWLRMISDALPFNYFVRGLQEMMNGTLADAALPMVVICAFGVAFFVVAIVTFRWDSNAPVKVRWQRRRVMA